MPFLNYSLVFENVSICYTPFHQYISFRKTNNTNQMIFLLVVGILCIDRIKLKIVGDDKFLGMSGEKIVKADYKDALPIKLNTMKDISEKTLENKNGEAITETGFWFFPKSYVFKRNKSEGKQAFRIVFYAPNEYILMKGDNCLGFREDSKFKRIDCTEGNKVTKFRMCTNRMCDSYFDLKKDLECIKGFLGMGGGGRGPNFGNQYPPFYGGRPDGDLSSDSSPDDRRSGHRGQSPFGGGYPRYGGRPRGSYSDDDDNLSDSNDVFTGCKEFNYGIPGYGPGGRRGGGPQPQYGSAYPNRQGYHPLYNRNDRSGFPYNC